MDVQHDGHVDAAQAVPEAVVDVIDSVINKNKAVDVSEVYVEEIPFSEVYNPDL
jgi:hypothetical protein